MSAPSEWYGFDVQLDGTVVVDENVDLQAMLRKERETAEAFLLLDSLWNEPIENDPVIKLTKFGQMWLKKAFVEVWEYIKNGPSTERLAKKVAEEFDLVEEEPKEYIEVTSQVLNTTVVVNGTVKSEVSNVKKRTKLVKGARSKFACAVAKRVYTKFGNRPMTEANVLVTRRYLVKLIENDYPDLRTVDKNVAIDRALFLSFVPTKEFLSMKLVFETETMKTRITGEKETLFGRIFRVSGDPVE